MSAGTAARGEPLSFTVTYGKPTAGELAAVLAVLLAASAAAAPPSPSRAPASRWADRSRALAPIARPGRDAWRVSALPR